MFDDLDQEQLKNSLSLSLSLSLSAIWKEQGSPSREHELDTTQITDIGAWVSISEEKPSLHGPTQILPNERSEQFGFEVDQILI